MQSAGVSGMNSGNLIALRIFHADPDYVHTLHALGYPAPDAEKLVALRVHRVDPEEVKQIRALGYQPTLDELIQMRILTALIEPLGVLIRLVIGGEFLQRLGRVLHRLYDRGRPGERVRVPRRRLPQLRAHA
jgi:hypothetical protein